MELSIRDLREIVRTDATGDSPWQEGSKYLVRTVTMTIVGHLRQVYPGELLFCNAAWIADTGRFHDALRDGTLDEIEPFVDDVIVGRGSIVDATVWRHDLPIEQK